MDAYYDTYTSPEPLNEFMRDMSVKDSIPSMRELLSPSGSEPDDMRHGSLLCENAKARSAQGWADILSFHGHQQDNTLPAQWHCSAFKDGSAGLD